MKHLLVATLGLFFSAVLHADTECEDVVDMADSLDFHSMHIECSDDPVTLYDQESKSNFFSKKGKVITAYADQTQSSNQAVTASQRVVALNAAHKPLKGTAQSNAGVTFNIREPFTLTGGPQSALNGLYVQMAQYCASGWSKQKEWVVAVEAGFLLHYQFTCSD